MNFLRLLTPTVTSLLLFAPSMPAQAALSSGSSMAGSSLSSALVADFYEDEPEGVANAEPGTVLRRENIAHGVERILYSSRLEDGTPTYVSGTVMEPTEQWEGPGEAPTVVMAPGTRGMADSCAPSRSKGFLGPVSLLGSSINVNYESPLYSKFLDRGMRLVITDYIGLGTPGVHTYANRLEQGHALIDAARAAASGPVAFFGYSQGGGAAAAAAELVPEYAPELDLRATFAGAPPADLVKVLAGSPRLGPNLAYAIEGFSARSQDFSAAVDEYFNAKGKHWLEENSRSCIVDSSMRWSMTDLSELTDTGISMSEFITSDERVRSVLEAQRIGNLRPAGKVLVGSAPNDDIVDHAQAMQLATDWQELGGEVETLEDRGGALSSRVAGGHIAGFIGQYEPAIDWLEETLSTEAESAE